MRKITLLFISFMTIVTLQLNAQGQDCSNPIVINSLPYTTSDDTANYGDNYDNGSSPCSSYYMNGDEVIYSFTPTSDMNVDFTMSNIGSTYSGIHVLDGCVDSTPTCIGFVGNISTADRVVNANLTSGTTYYIVISTWATPQNTTYDLNITEITCPTPTNVTATPTSFTEVDITWTAGDSETNWTYEYGVTGFTQGTGTMGTSMTSSLNLTSLTQGETYDIYIQANCGGGDDSTFATATWTQPLPPPANDNLAGAIPIIPSAAGTGCTMAGFTLNFSTDGTTDSGMDGTCDTTDTGLDQFFTWTATTDGLVFNSDSVTPGNPGIVIRDTSGSEISCSGTYSDDVVLSGWAIGDDLIIQIYDYDGSVSDVAFCLEEYTIPPPPENDDCANATPVGSLPFNETMDATGATNNNGFITACSNAMNDGVWYTFTTVDAGTIDIAITQVDGWDPEVALYTGSCGAFTCVARADSNAGGGSEILSGVSVEAATQYWINIGDWDNDDDNPEGPFTIDISTSDTTTVLKVESNSIENFTLFPTIVKDKLSFTSQERVDVLTIYNIMGQKVLSRKPVLTNGSINVSSLSSGMYIVKVKAGNSLGSYKIIKE